MLSMLSKKKKKNSVHDYPVPFLSLLYSKASIQFSIPIISKCSTNYMQKEYDTPMLRLVSSRREFSGDFTTKFTTRLVCAHRLKFCDTFGLNTILLISTHVLSTN